MAPRVLLVTDPSFGDEITLRCVVAVAAELPPGEFGVQLRDKARPRVSLRVFALALRAVTRRAGAWLIVNGDARLARDVGADGVHLGRGAGTVAEARAAFGRKTWVSVAAHTDEDVGRAAADGADGALVSPIFPTRPPSPGSAAKRERGLGALRAARAAAGARVQIYALGGITPERVRGCARAGADGVAVLRALLASDRPAAVARAIHDALPARW
jgi:thiamine-phosphate diphosphorylase